MIVLVAILDSGNDQDKVEVQSSVGDNVERASISVLWHVGVNTGIMQHAHRPCTIYTYVDILSHESHHIKKHAHCADK
jgi:hypothetical protein